MADYVFEHVLLPRPEPSRVRAAGASMALVQPAAGAPPAGEALAVPTGGEARAVVFPPFAPPPTTGANFGADPGPQAVPAPAAIAPTPTGSEQPNTASPAPHPGAAPALSRAAIDPAFDDPWGDRLSGAFVDGPAPTQTG